MSIVKRTNKAGGTYYWNTSTNKFSTKAAYASSVRGRASSTGRTVAKAAAKAVRAGNCSSFGRGLKVNQSSSAGRGLRCKCSPLPRCKRG